MTMGRSFGAVDMHTDACDRMGSQAPLAAGLAKVPTAPDMHRLPAALLLRVSFSGCLVAAAQHCGRTDEEIAPDIPMSQSYMSRFMRGVAEKWARRLVSFMRITQSLAPLQWLANQMGFDLVRRERTAAEIERDALLARPQELERGRAAA